MGDRRPLLSVGGPQTLCLPPVQSTFKDPAEGSAGGSRSSPSRAPLASEAVVSPLVISCSGDSEKPSQDPGSSASIDFPLPSCKRNRLLLTVWPISGNVAKRQTFLRELPILRPVLSGPQLEFLTIPGWPVSTTGVPSPLQILVQPL